MYELCAIHEEWFDANEDNRCWLCKEETYNDAFDHNDDDSFEDSNSEDY